MENKNWFFSSEDLSFLVALDHTKISYLPQFNECVLDSDEKILQCMNRLIQDGVIEYSDINGEYYIDREISKIFSMINSADVVINVSFDSFKSNNIYMYILSDLTTVVIQEAENRKNVFKLSERSLSLIVSQWLEEGLLPVCDDFDIKDFEFLGDIDSEEQLVATVDEVIVRMDFYKSALIKTIIIFRSSINYGIAVIKNKNIHVQAYSFRSLNDEIKREIESNDNS